MFEHKLIGRDVIKLDIVAADDTIEIRIPASGIMLATFKDGGEIAFITACFHGYKLVERCIMGTSSRCVSMYLVFVFVFFLNK